MLAALKTQIPGGLFPSLIAGVLAAALSALLSQPNPFLYWVDKPNHRSLHATPTPRTGGVAVLLAVVMGVLVSGSDAGLSVLSGVAIVALALLGLLDDRHSLSVRARWPVQIFAFALMVFSALGMYSDAPLMVAWGLLLSLAGVWFLNLFNFMDGMDGFAGSMTLVSSGALCVHAAHAAHPAAALALLLMCAAAGFLCLNWPRAKIFLGDAGAYGIAAILFALSLQLLIDGAVTLPALLLIFLPFWGDATLTLCKRILRKERFWEAHRTHYYQRAVQQGWPVSRVLACEILDMVLMAALSVWAMQHDVTRQWLLLASAVLMHLLMFALLSRVFAKATAGKPDR